MCTVCALDVNATVNIRNNVCVTGEKLNVSGLAYKIMSSRKYHGPYFDTVRHLGGFVMHQWSRLVESQFWCAGPICLEETRRTANDSARPFDAQKRRGSW